MNLVNVQALKWGKNIGNEHEFNFYYLQARAVFSNAQSGVFERQAFNTKIRKVYSDFLRITLLFTRIMIQILKNIKSRNCISDVTTSWILYSDLKWFFRFAINPWRAAKCTCVN